MMKKDVDIGPIMAMMRSAYRLVKIAPFAYSVIYIVGIGIYAFCGEDMSDFIGERNSHSGPHGRLWLAIKQIKQHEKRKETIFTYESSQI